MANLRILLGFAFVPAGLKKVLDQPFTDPSNTGPFHEFLHAFYATGMFYQFVGAIQLLIAVLLMTQTFAALGALMALPVITTITVFCWSTGVIPTAVVTSLMLAGTLVLVAWEVYRWLTVFDPAFRPEKDTANAAPPIEMPLWRTCGAAILCIYGLACWAYGGVYRPRGMDLHQPAFYALLLVALCPVVTWIVEQRRRSRLARSAVRSAEGRSEE